MYKRQNIWANKKYQDWRISVFERDGYKCQICGSEEKLHAHHIEPYNTCIEKQYEISNGQTLCCSCHCRLESTGRKPSEQTKLKMSSSRKGRIWRQESREKLSKNKKGSSIPKDTREKISKTLMGNIPWSVGKKFSEEHKNKLSLAKKGKQPWNKGLTGRQVSWNKGMKKIKDPQSGETTWTNA